MGQIRAFFPCRFATKAKSCDCFSRSCNNRRKHLSEVKVPEEGGLDSPVFPLLPPPGTRGTTCCKACSLIDVTASSSNCFPSSSVSGNGMGWSTFHSSIIFPWVVHTAALHIQPGLGVALNFAQKSSTCLSQSSGGNRSRSVVT